MKNVVDVVIALLIIVNVGSAIVLHIQGMIKSPKVEYGDADWFFNIIKITIPAMIVFVIISYLI